MSESQHYDEQPDTMRHLDDALVSLSEAVTDTLTPCEARDLQRAIASTSRVVDSVEYRRE